MPATPPAPHARSPDRVVLAGILVVTALAWAYLVFLRLDMRHAGMQMAEAEAWSAGQMTMLLVMWVVMMIAMMLPTASGAGLAFAAIAQRRRARGRPYAPTAVFLLGYVAVWSGFSVLATVAQWGLHEASLLTPMGVGTSPILGGALFVAAGGFQWTPAKNACLTRCRSPVFFLMTRWRAGHLGAFAMGFHHGLYCVGCCWLLMALLFVAGVMNLLWIATLTGLVLIEKLSGGGERVARITGGALTAVGVAMLAVGLSA